MFRLILSVMFLAGALGLNAQHPTPSHPFPASDAAACVMRRIEPLVQIGAHLREQNLRDPAGTGFLPPGHHAHEPRALPGHGFTIQNTLHPVQSFTVEPRFPGEYSVRDNLNPLGSYTIRVQPWDGFTIRNNLHPLESYVVNPQPVGGYTLHNQLNPMESYSLRSQPFDRFTVSGAFDRLESWAPWRSSHDVFSIRSAFDPFEMHRPFDGYGIQNHFGLPSSHTFSPSHSLGPSFPNDPPRFPGLP